MITRVEEKLSKKLVPILLIAIAGLLAYCNSFTAPFLLDDFGSIVNNYAIRNPLDPLAIWKFYSNRFILYYTLSINFYFHDYGVVGYHVTNLLLHMFNGYLVYRIFYSILSLKHFEGKLPNRYKGIISTLSAIIFVVHPMQVNAVTYIVQRTASLAAAFYFLAILYYIKYRTENKKRHFLLTILFIILAMFTKENTITIPFMLILIEFMFFLGDGKTSWKKRILLIGLLLLTVPVIPSTNLFLKGYSQSDPNVSFKASTSMDRFQYFYTELNVIILYIKLLFIPDKQNFDYSNDFPFSHTIMENYSYVSFAILLIIGLIALYNLRKNKLLSLGIFWFFMGLAVESSFISIKDVYFEHRLYFPVAGFIMCLVGIIFTESRKRNQFYVIKKPLLFFVVLSLFLIPFYTGLTLKRNYVYGDAIRLWSDTAQKAPKSDRAHSVLATAYMDKYENGGCKDQEYFDLAEKEYKKAIELYNWNGNAHCNLAKLYLLGKQYDDCIAEANQAIRIDPSVYGYHNLGAAYKAKGKSHDAIDAFLAGYKIDKKCTFILKDLGDIYYDTGDLKNAKKYYSEFTKNSSYTDKDVKKRLDELKSVKT